MKTLWGLLAVLGLAAALAAPAAAEEKEKDVKQDTRVFELRTYYAADGKMDALNTRFKDHTNKLISPNPRN